MFEKIVLVLGFFAVAVAIGLFTRRHTRDVDGFVLGGRRVGPWLSAFAYGTSYFSAVIFVGYAGQFGWKFGLASTWIGIGNALLGSLAAWLILGPRLRELSQRLNARTMPELFGAFFASRALRVAAAFIVFVFLIPYTASVYNGLSRLFGMAFGIPYEWCVLAMAVITCVYVLLGGYMATAVNDFVQGLVMLVGIVVVVAAVLAGQGGFTEAIAAMGAVDAGTAGAAGEAATGGAFTSLFGPDPLDLLSVIILTSLGTWAMPQMVSKFYAIKDVAAVHKGAIISTVFALVVAGGCYFLGGFGRLFADGVSYGAAGTPLFDSIIPQMISTLPDILIGIVIVLVLSASMSTLSSLVLTSSSTLVLDLVKDNLIKNMSSTGQVRWMRVFLALFVALSVFIAVLQFHSANTFIAQLMGISWGALAGSFIGPLVWMLFWKRTHKVAAWASFVFGVGFTLANMAFGFIPSPIMCGALTMLISLVLVPVTSLLANAVSRATLPVAVAADESE